MKPIARRRSQSRVLANGAAEGIAAPINPLRQTVTKQQVTAALPKLESLAKKLVDTGQIPGVAIAIVFEDVVVYMHGFGVCEAGKSAGVDSNTVFQLASCSKPIAATVVAAIVSGKAVTWDTPIADIDSTWRLKERYATAEVTIGDLFAHRSGLPGGAGNDLEDLGFSRQEIIRRLRFVEPASSFRSGYSYSNFGLTAGAICAAKAIGMSWEDAAEEKLYKRLGMASTSSRHIDFLKRSNRASLHIPVNGKWMAKLTREPDAQSPAGGVSSNVRDLAQWLRLELSLGNYDGEQIIERDAMERAHTPVIMRSKNAITGEASFYGFGWGVDYGRHGPVWAHAGAFSVGARTNVSILPKERLGIVVLSNGFPSGVPEGLTDSFYELVFDGQVSRDWAEIWTGFYNHMYGPPAIAAAAARFARPPTPPAPPMGLAAYVGAYANDYVGQAVIAEDKGVLVLQLGPNGHTVFPLAHFDRDLFTYRSAAETPDLLSAATFEVGPGGKAMALVLDDFNNVGHGVLMRVDD